MTLGKIPEAINDIRQGKMIILVDDEDRENEGDLVMAASAVTPQAIAFMATQGRGLICLAMEARKILQLQIPMMPVHNHVPFGAAFTVSVEAKEGVTTGISAHDRAHTVHTLIDPAAGPDDWVSPGHLFPLKARPGGVLVRNGHTEASIDLARLAGLDSSAVICEIMNDDGTMARLPQLIKFSLKHNLGLYSIEDLVKYLYIQRTNLENSEEATAVVGHC
ncbi:MAG: 3,4-dihydroxy-2-butanone-4-phosphate synthase [Desulfobacteraceae bacterium]|jgi:3,4-dihydroxy 2-butanone 4-phosphate synthase/GTP cyclohydrolase II